MTREQYTTRQCWFEFGASNEQARYGYGTQAEADKYLDILNEKRVVNVYWADPLDDYHAEKVLRLHDRNDVMNLDDELAARKGLR